MIDQHTKDVLATIRRWHNRDLYSQERAPSVCRSPSVVPALHQEMGIRVRTRMVRYRGLTSTQCVLLPVSEACGIDKQERTHWPTNRERALKRMKERA